MALVREGWLAAFSSGGFEGHSYPAVGQPESTPEGAGPAPPEVPWGCRRGTGGRDCVLKERHLEMPQKMRFNRWPFHCNIKENR